MTPALTTGKQSSRSNASASRATLSAVYIDTTNSLPSQHQFYHSISAPIPDKDLNSIGDKINYLSKLRNSVKTLQDEINVFLTQKMEEDKLHEKIDTDGIKVKKTGEKPTDEIEEENYGEEGSEDFERG